MNSLNETHDPGLKSWVGSANLGGGDFPIQNLPFGIFRDSGAGENDRGRAGIAIGDMILDLKAANAKGLFTGEAQAAAETCFDASLNRLMALGPGASSALRLQVSRLLRADSPERSELLVPMAEAEMQVPAEIGDFTDFWASIYHATNAGSLFRPDNPLLPNYKHLPLAYHGRASSITVSGTSLRRPVGQRRGADGGAPEYGPSVAVDYELEAAIYIGPGNDLGTNIAVADARSHIFGLSLLNDWTARDMQAWEGQPLGPFLGKSFATTVSPWVVTLEALAPFRCPAFARPDGDPEPPANLASGDDASGGGIDIALEVAVSTQKMRDGGEAPLVLGRSNFRDMYWTIAQMLAHHTSNGCNMRPGDMMGSGTVSGTTDENLGSLLELSQAGKRAFDLPGGETRTYLENGDEVIMRGRCANDGHTSIGFGECRAVVTAAGETASSQPPPLR